MQYMHSDNKRRPDRTKGYIQGRNERLPEQRTYKVMNKIVEPKYLKQEKTQRKRKELSSLLFR